MDDAQPARRFGLIEQQLRALSDHRGVACPAFASDGLPDAGRADGDGRTVHAISLLRKLTGASLVEAKRVVDAL